MAECSLREATAYARTAHLSTDGATGRSPILYMNGWDLFEALPELWEDGIDAIPGTIDNQTAEGYAKLHTSFRLHSSPEAQASAIRARCRQLCKLFIGPAGAITRFHQDNHDAHAWLCNLRGHKLYVLCSPEDTNLVATARSRSKGLGTQYAGRLDPLEPTARQRAQGLGLTLYATVLGPGETILAPANWWHYAVSLTPSITLMCNFWSRRNMRGLEDCFLAEFAKALDLSKQSNPKTKHDEARDSQPSEAQTATYRIVSRPFVFVRDRPSTRAAYLGILRTGSSFTSSLTHDGWLRTAEPYQRGRHGWVLGDGAKVGLGILVQKQT